MNYFYIFLLFSIVSVSLTIPIKASNKLLSILIYILAAFYLLSFVGVFLFVSELPLKYYKKICKDGESVCIETDEERYNILAICIIIVLSNYLIPFLLRPLDAFKNFSKLGIGLLAYLIFLPSFNNVVMIYSMCNLHDISWGNRPEDGTEIFTSNKKL